MGESMDTHVAPQTLVGQAAPDFTAKAVVGDEFVDYTLSDNWKQGRYTLLFFYPKDFTFVCPTELIAFSDRIGEFETRNCNVASVSIDSQEVHYAWKQTPRKAGGVGDIQYPMISDTNHKIGNAYGVLRDHDQVAYRATAIIDTNGKIRHFSVNDTPLGRNVDEFLRLLDALQYATEHGEVCPANWHKGDMAIKANPKDSKQYFETVNS